MIKFIQKMKRETIIFLFLITVLGGIIPIAYLFEFFNLSIYNLIAIFTIGLYCTGAYFLLKFILQINNNDPLKKEKRKEKREEDYQRYLKLKNQFKDIDDILDLKIQFEEKEDYHKYLKLKKQFENINDSLDLEMQFDGIDNFTDLKMLYEEFLDLKMQFEEE